jgi:hypothetical protein
MARTLDKKSIKILNTNISKKIMNSSDPNEKAAERKRLARVSYSPSGGEVLITDGTGDGKTTSDYYKTSKEVPQADHASPKLNKMFGGSSTSLGLKGKVHAL